MGSALAPERPGSVATASSPDLDFRALVDALLVQNQFVIHYDLEGVAVAARALRLARPAQRLVLVGGTNGKGTVCAHLSAYACAAGLRVGFYSSPHLLDIRERIRIDGEPIDAAAFVEHVGAAYRGFARATDELRALSYFELITLGAWSAFASEPLDLAIFEVGLGGRLDATNVLEPDLSVITSVSLDHRDLLGETLDEIATEKAGILRSGRPALLHRDAGGYDVLLQAAERTGAALEPIAGGDDPASWCRALAWRAFQLAFPTYATVDVRTEADNAVRWPGRQQRVCVGDREVLVDGAHNAAALRATARWLEGVGGGGFDVIVGFSGRRDPRELLPFLRVVASRIIATEVRGAPSVPASEIATAAVSLGLDATVTTTIEEALETASERAAVVGSLYLVGEALAALGCTIEDLAVYVPSKRSESSR